MTIRLKTYMPIGGEIESETLEIEVDWTSNTGGASTTSTADANFYSQTITEAIKGRTLVMAQTVPHATAPTTLYDVAVNDENGEDLFNGGLENRSATVAESVYVLSGTEPVPYPITGALSIAVTAAGDTKKGKVRLFLK